jgi:hypothetical protein
MKSRGRVTRRPTFVMNTVKADKLDLRPQVVSKWRKRFHDEGMDGLEDRPLLPWAVSLPAPHADRWHAELDMTIRTGVAIVSLGTLAVACSAAPGPSASSPSVPGPSAPSGATVESSESSTPAPGVSWLRVSPQEGLRGATVSLDVACLDNLGPVRSPVLEIGALKGDPDGHQPWHLTGTATVRSDAAPGQYPVSASCGTDQLSAAFTVVPHP